MPYKDPVAQREYQRRWVARRRREWLAVHGPCVDCSSSDQLQVDHVDPSTKVDHKVWSWSAKRREAELAKCVVRCKPCHEEKTRANDENAQHGEGHHSARLTEEEVIEIRRLVDGGTRQSDVAEQFGITQQHVSRLHLGQKWVHLLS